MIAYLVGVLALVVGLLVSIALHEVGHLVPAKLFGVKVPRYFIGFGPTLWSTRRGETEYGVKAIPLGGFVSLAGMYLPEPVGRPDRVRADGRTTAVQDARAYAQEELGPGERHRAFHALSVPKKLAVMFGGPVVNLLICLVLLAVIVAGIGAPTPTTRLESVSACLPAPDGSVPAADSAACVPAPAAAAGLAGGDRILTWGEASTPTWPDLQAAIAAGGTSPAQVRYERGGQEHTATVAPVLVPRPVVGEDGAPVTGPDGHPVLEDRPFAGVGASVELVPQSITRVPGLFWQQLTGTFSVLVRLPQHLAAAATSIVTGQPRTDGVMSVVGVGRAAGEIASSDVGAAYTPLARTADLLSILASLNMALFAFNMIPLLPLDGGHIAGALWEGLRRTVARLTGRPDPGPVDTARLLPLTYVVVALLGAMSLVLIVADIVNPLSVFG